MEIILNPFIWTFLFLITILIFGKITKKNKFFLLIILLINYFFSSPAFLKPFFNQLQSSYEPLSLEWLKSFNDSSNLIVLGAGSFNLLNAPPNSQLNSTTLTRLMEGIRIFKECNGNLNLITSGNSLPGKSQAELGYEFAIILGIPQNKAYFNSNPKNTKEEAFEYVSNFKKTTPLIIVTSAFHMKRAVYEFEKLGVKTIYPAPTDFRHLGKKNNLQNFLPNSDTFKGWSIFFKENLGILLAKWRNEKP